MVFLVCALLIIGVIAWLLFMPMVLHIDTFTGICMARWGPVRASLQEAEGDLRYRLRAPFYRREGSVFDLPFNSAEKPRPRPERKPARRKRASGQALRRVNVLRLSRGVFASFRVRRFRWYLDTGDPLWNAWLFPLFHLWRGRGHDVRISFTRRDGLLLILSNNAFRLLWAVLRAYTNQPKQQRHEQGHE